MDETSDSLISTGVDGKPLSKLKWEIEWRNATPLILLNLSIPYGFYVLFTDTMWQTFVFSCFVYISSLMGITLGPHRLWTHKTYKAKLPLQFVLVILATMPFQGSVIHWSRDHRLHHKYSDTDVDPHNARRGFFFSHIGWLLVKKQPQVIAQGRSIDMSDLQNHPLLSFQHRYYIPLALFFCFFLPSTIPLLWGEKLWSAFFVAGMLRLVLSQHATFLINSAAHTWGVKPYDKGILPAEHKLIAILTTGEGLHNFHHTFPWDYRAGELGGYWTNPTWLVLDLLSKVGLAYDFKTVSAEMIEKRVKRTGDGSHPGWALEHYLTEENKDIIVKNEKSINSIKNLRFRGIS
ncbi:acyl-CoA Delta(11) desaturase-like [Anticarsia gemmatalis]|uniref:acyl-CoA Delta(11) desaturase-like n=1 Tax=Anticarsia gemmatalis TaxID=129554 RepID=UPI003F770413